MPLSVSPPEQPAASFLTEVRQRLLQLGSGQGPLLATVPAPALCCGKLTRAWLVHHAAAGLSRDLALTLATAVELIQAASLAQDDWMDREPRRRTQPALWKSLGAPSAILASTQLIAEAYRLLATGLPAAIVAPVVTVFSRTLATACIGQWKDITWPAESLTLPAYEELAAQKTGSLLLLPLELTAVAALLAHLHADGSLDRSLDLIQTRLHRAALITHPSIRILTEKWQAQLDQQRHALARQRDQFFAPEPLPRAAPIRIHVA
jgi:geranylgeranyl pyrophosphate synthase